MCPSAIPSRRTMISHQLSSVFFWRMQDAKLSEKAHERAKRLTIKRLIATM